MSVKLIFLTVHTEENRRAKFVKMKGSKEHQVGRWGGKRGVDDIFRHISWWRGTFCSWQWRVVPSSSFWSAGQKLTQLELDFLMKLANIKVFLTRNCIFITRVYNEELRNLQKINSRSLFEKEMCSLSSYSTGFHEKKFICEEDKKVLDEHGNLLIFLRLSDPFVIDYSRSSAVESSALQTTSFNCF